MAAVNFGVVPVINYNPAQNGAHSGGGAKAKILRMRARHPPHHHPSYNSPTPHPPPKRQDTPGSYVQTPDPRFQKYGLRTHYIPEPQLQQYVQSKDPKKKHKYRGREQVPKVSLTEHGHEAHPEKIMNDPNLSGIEYFNVPEGKPISAVQKFDDFEEDDISVRYPPTDHTYSKQFNQSDMVVTVDPSHKYVNWSERKRGHYPVSENKGSEEQEISCVLEEDYDVEPDDLNPEVTSEQEEIDEALRDLALEDYNSEGSLCREVYTFNE